MNAATGDTPQPGFQQIQTAFAAHIRDPQQNAPPRDIEDRRMQIYRELFYNNIEGFLSSGFPVLRSLTDDRHWHAMVRDFFASHRCNTPYFLEITREFLHYLQEERQPQPQDPAFLLELAHYEWLEIAADVDPETIPVSGFNPDGNLLHGKPVLSPLAYVACYEFPVHRIGPDFRPVAPGDQPTWLIIYRDCHDQVRFMEINVVTARMLVLLQEDPQATGRAVIDRIQAELQHPLPEIVLQGGMQALQHLRATGILLGTELKSI